MHMVLKKKKLIYPLLFVSVLVILLTVLALKQCAPFGNYSLVYDDADYQYLDFYAYLKDYLIHGFYIRLVLVLLKKKYMKYRIFM